MRKLKQQTLHETPTSLGGEQFNSGNIKFGTEVSAQARDGVTGDTFAEATIVAQKAFGYINLTKKVWQWNCL